MHYINLRYKVQTRVIINSKEYNDNIRDWKNKFVSDLKVIQSSLNEYLKMSDEELLMCVPEVCGTVDNQKMGLFQHFKSQASGV